MKLFYLGLSFAPIALAGHWSACVIPVGKRDDEATEECCKMEQHQQPFPEIK